MIRLTILLSLLATLTSLTAQTVTSLEFPYKEGCQLNYEGISKSLNADGEVVEEREFSFAYEVLDAPDIGEYDLVRFKIFSRGGGIRARSFLYMNDKEMVWWIEDKDVPDDPVRAIKLPLKEGKKWNTKLYGNKAKLRCIGTDLDIETGVGTYKGFGIETVYYSDYKGVKLKTVFREYYTQKLGKIRTEEEIYVLKSKKEMKLASEEVMKLVSYKLPDGTSKQATP